MAKAGARSRALLQSLHGHVGRLSHVIAGRDALAADGRVEGDSSGRTCAAGIVISVSLSFLGLRGSPRKPR